MVVFPLCYVLIHAELGIEDAECISADINIQKSLNQMCARSAIIINCVGPVSDHICIVNNTHTHAHTHTQTHTHTHIHTHTHTGKHFKKILF